MVRHQHERVYVTRAPFPRLAHALEKVQPVFTTEEDRLTVIATHYDVLCEAGEVEAGRSRHKHSNAAAAEAGYKKRPAEAGRFSDLSPFS